MDKIATLSSILEQNPSDAFARYALALEYANQGDTDNALAQFDLLAEYQPDYVPGHQMAAQTLLKLGHTQEAIQRLKTGIAAAEKTGNSHAISEMSGMLAELSA